MPNGSDGMAIDGKESQSKLGTSTRDITSKKELKFISGLAPDRIRNRDIERSKRHIGKSIFFIYLARINRTTAITTAIVSNEKKNCERLIPRTLKSNRLLKMTTGVSTTENKRLPNEY